MTANTFTVGINLEMLIFVKKKEKYSHHVTALERAKKCFYVTEM
jgi:hypothetical protein